MITRDQFEESARQVLATGRKQGTVLVQIGALAPKDLFRGLIAQVREIVVSLCGWDAGNWRFLEGLPPQEEIVSLRLHPAGLIFEGLALIAADPRWSGVWDLRQLELRPAADAPLTIEQIDAPDTARRLFSLVEQGRSPQELARLIGRDGGGNGRSALRARPARVGRARPRPRPRRSRAGAPAAANRRRRRGGTGDGASRRGADDAEIRSLREKISSMAAQLASLSFYQILGVTPKSDAGHDQALVHRAREGIPPRPVLPPRVRGPAGGGELDLHARQRGLRDAAATPRRAPSTTARCCS